MLAVIHSIIEILRLYFGYKGNIEESVFFYTVSGGVSVRDYYHSIFIANTWDYLLLDYKTGDISD